MHELCLIAFQFLFRCVFLHQALRVCLLFLLLSDNICLSVDDYDQTFTTPKIMTVTGGGQEDTYSNDAMSSSEHDLNIWEDDQSANEAADNTEVDEPAVKVKRELVSNFYCSIECQV